MSIFRLTVCAWVKRSTVKQQWLPRYEQTLLFLVLWRTSNTTLNNSHETENVTKAVDHKPIDSKTCTEFRELLSYDSALVDILQIPLILTHAQTKSNYTLKKF